MKRHSRTLLAFLLSATTLSPMALTPAILFAEEPESTQDQQPAEPEVQTVQFPLTLTSQVTGDPFNGTVRVRITPISQNAPLPEVGELIEGSVYLDIPANGQLLTSPFLFHEVGTYEYEVALCDQSAVNPDLRVDPTVYYFNVEVNKNSVGQLYGSTSLTKGGVVQEQSMKLFFTSTYTLPEETISPASVTLPVHTSVKGNPETPAEFSISLTAINDEAKAILPKAMIAKLNGTQSAAFDEITFTEPGEYLFEAASISLTAINDEAKAILPKAMIAKLNGTQSAAFDEITFTEPGEYLFEAALASPLPKGYTAEVDAPIEVKVAVLKDTDGKLTPHIIYKQGESYPAAISYTMNYEKPAEAAPITFTFPVHTQVKGNPETPAEFSVSLTAANDAAKAVLPEAMIAKLHGTDSVFFDKIIFSQPGEYLFEAALASPLPAGYTAKVNAPIQVKFTVTEAQDGSLTFNVRYTPGEYLFEAALASPLPAGYTAKVNAPIQVKFTVTEAQDGSLTFNVRYTQADAALVSINYTINYEKPAPSENVEKEKEKEKEKENKTTDNSTKRTGVNTAAHGNLLAYGALMVASATMAAVLFKNRKDD